MRLFPKITSSIFFRLVATFLFFTMTLCCILIFLSYSFNKYAIEQYTRQDILQFTEEAVNHFEESYRNRVFNNLKQLSSSSFLDDYLISTEAEKAVIARKLEQLFLQTMARSSAFREIFFVDPQG